MADSTVAQDAAQVQQALDLVIDKPVPALLSRFAERWLLNRNGRSMPSRRDMDPTLMPWALPHIFLLKRNEEGRFAYHLVGERFAIRLGGNAKGKTPDKIFEKTFAAEVESFWNKAADEKSIYLVNSVHRVSGLAPSIAHRITLPLSDDDETVDCLIGVVDFHDPLTAGGNESVEIFASWKPVADLPR